VVACWGEQGELAESVAHECREAGADEPAQLFHVGVGDQWFTPDEDDWDGEEGDGNEDGEHAENCVEST